MADGDVGADGQRQPMSVCSTEPSWILVRAPMSIHSLSPRKVAPNQTLASSPSRTRPMRLASGATKKRPFWRQFRRDAVERIKTHRHDSLAKAAVIGSKIVRP